MGFISSSVDLWTKALDAGTTSSRLEYFYSVLFLFVVTLLLYFSMLFIAPNGNLNKLILLISAISAIPYASLVSRRFNDIGLPGIVGFWVCIITTALDFFNYENTCSDNPMNKLAWCTFIADGIVFITCLLLPQKQETK